MSTVLLGPADGKPDNYVLTEDGTSIIPVDNEQSFLPEYVAAKRHVFYRNYMLKSILLCSPLVNQPIPADAIETFQSWKPAKMVEDWISDLCVVAKNWEHSIPDDAEGYLQKMKSK